jgi:hypothetical protein
MVIHIGYGLYMVADNVLVGGSVKWALVMP